MTNLLLGKKAIIEKLNNSDIIISVHSISLIPEIKKICDKKNIIYKIENKIFFKNISENHQGIIAFVKKTNYLTDDFNLFINKINKKNKNRKIIVILDKINDPGNFGSIIRTCDAFDVDGIIIKKDNQSQINDFVIKSSIGSIYNSNILKIANLSNVVNLLKKNNFWIVATTLEESKNINEIDFDFNVCLIIGNEKNGVSKNLLDKADYKTKIKMFGNVQSLNVSVATGIILNYIKNYHYEE